MKIFSLLTFYSKSNKRIQGEQTQLINGFISLQPSDGFGFPLKNPGDTFGEENIKNNFYKIKMLKKDKDFFASTLYKMYPDAKTELEYENDFQLLIAILMSAQTTDKQVNKVNKEFFKVLVKPEDGVNLGIEKIKSYINSISFFNNKAINIYKTCEILSEKNLEDFHTIGELTKLAGVGIKTAKVFLAVTKDAPYLAVDTHVHRVLNRVGLVKTKTPEETDKVAGKLFSKQNLADLHHSLILFGRYHCTATRKPKCKECPFLEKCSYKEKNI